MEHFAHRITILEIAEGKGGESGRIRSDVLSKVTVDKLASQEMILNNYY